MRSQYPTHSYSHSQSQQIPAWSNNAAHGMLSPALSGASGVKDFF